MKTVLYFRSYSNFNASRKLAGVMRAAHEFGWNVQTVDTGRESLFWCREREKAFRDILCLHGKSLSRFSGRRDTGTDSYSIDELGAWLNKIPHPAGVLAVERPVFRRDLLSLHKPKDRFAGRADADKGVLVRLVQHESPDLIRRRRGPDAL